jgi:SAM-dependent methyltransferase
MNPDFAAQYGDYERWHWWFRGRERILAAVLRRELAARPPGLVVSLGCGPAEGIDWLRPFLAPGGHVVGIDMQVANGAQHPIAVVTGRAESAPLRSACADVVLALDVIEHLDDDAAGLREATRLLIPGGLLVVTVPALPSLWGPQDVVNHHRRRYRKGTLRDAFARARLPAPRITYFNALLLPPIAAMRWLRNLGTADAERSDFEDSRPGLANDVLAAVFAAERHLVPRMPLPLGVSLLATLRTA